MEYEDEELVPLTQVLDDMYSDKGVVSLAARSYYYNHYATDEEKEKMDAEDRRLEILSYVITGMMVIMIIVAIIISFASQ